MKYCNCHSNHDNILQTPCSTIDGNMYITDCTLINGNLLFIRNLLILLGKQDFG